MNDRLIIRAANHYREWMRKHSLEPITEQKTIILDKMECMQRRLGQIRRWSEKFLKGMTPRIQTEVGKPSVSHISTPCVEVYRNLVENMVPDLTHCLIGDLYNASSMLKAMVGPETCNPLSIRNAVEELTVINDSWDEVTYQRGVLSVHIGNVSLDDGTEEVDLGNFILRLCLNDPMGMCLHGDDNNLVAGLLVEATNPVKENTGYCHPHVKNGQLCAGDGEDIMLDALRQGRLEDYFRIVEAIVRTYNDASPYEPLSDWYDPNKEGQSLCCVCEEWTHDEYVSYCPRCDSTFCENCNITMECKDCVEWYCDECMNSCEGCSDLTCVTCSKSCCNCNQTFCKKCLTECEQCGNLSCEECSLHCDECNFDICQECRGECGYCGDVHCISCLIECKKCKVYNCDICMGTCASCDKEMCADCIKYECDHCGVSTCKSCEAKHNCLLAEVSN